MLFHYEITFLAEGEECYVNRFNTDNVTVTETGIVAADNYGEVATKVTEFYGVENIVEVSFYELEDILTESELKDMLTEDDK